MHSFSCAMLILIILCGCDFPIVKENTALNRWIPFLFKVASADSRLCKLLFRNYDYLYLRCIKFDPNF